MARVKASKAIEEPSKAVRHRKAQKKPRYRCMSDNAIRQISRRAGVISTSKEAIAVAREDACNNFIAELSKWMTVYKGKSVKYRVRHCISAMREMGYNIAGDGIGYRRATTSFA